MINCAIPAGVFPNATVFHCEDGRGGGALIVDRSCWIFFVDLFNNNNNEAIYPKCSHLCLSPAANIINISYLFIDWCARTIAMQRMHVCALFRTVINSLYGKAGGPKRPSRL